MKKWVTVGDASIRPLCAALEDHPELIEQLRPSLAIPLIIKTPRLKLRIPREGSMDKEKMRKAFNVWMDEYENDPEAFEHTVTTVKRHLAERDAGEEQSYGDQCVRMLETYIERAEKAEAGEATTA